MEEPCRNLRLGGEKGGLGKGDQRSDLIRVLMPSKGKESEKSGGKTKLRREKAVSNL